MDGHLGYEKSEQSDNDDYRNGNVASRIEYLCKEYNCDLLISETTVESIVFCGLVLSQLFISITINIIKSKSKLSVLSNNYYK